MSAILCNPTIKHHSSLVSQENAYLKALYVLLAKAEDRVQDSALYKSLHTPVQTYLTAHCLKLLIFVGGNRQGAMMCWSALNEYCI